VANRYFKSQFHYNFFVQPVILAGYADLQAPTRSSLVNQGVTLTAVAYGSTGNNVTYAITGGGTAGSEVVTVTGNAISIQIESGVSTVTQVRTAINASGAAAALVTATGTSGATVASPLAATALSGYVEQVSAFYMPGVASILQDPAAAGTFNITLSDIYPKLIHASYSLQAATAVDLVPQQKSEAVASTKIVVVRNLAAATPTNVSAAARLYMKLLLNNSSVL
jgi:hypothetical protein